MDRGNGRSWEVPALCDGNDVGNDRSRQISARLCPAASQAKGVIRVATLPMVAIDRYCIAQDRRVWCR
jgi:hypothetical protein